VESGRQLACWLGLTPRGPLRWVPAPRTHQQAARSLCPGHSPFTARAAILAARRAERPRRPLTQLQAWALKQARDTHPNRAAVALSMAVKMADVRNSDSSHRIWNTFKRVNPVTAFSMVAV
jgi:hypothetical protein